MSPKAFSTSQQQVERIAIVGGGITGLTSAFYASKKYPSASISLIESSNRLGGAVESTYLPISKGATTVCERGPRTLRASAPRAPTTYDLIDALGLRESLISVPKNSTTGSTRYILYPDHLVPIPTFNPRLVRRHIASIPAPPTLRPQQLITLLRLLATEPLFASFIGGLLRGISYSAPRLPDVHDESIGSFLARRMGHRVVDNLISPVMNGLCAGDVYQLSVKALLPCLWELETRGEEARRKGGRGGILGLMWQSLTKSGSQADTRDGSAASVTSQLHQREAIMLKDIRRGPAGELERDFADKSVFSFRGGLQELPSALEVALRGAKNVNIQMGTSVQDISFHEGEVVLSISNHNNTSAQRFTHVICTTPYNNLISAATVNNNNNIPPMPAATVMVVTLIFPSPCLNHPYRGFGYLIPNSIPANQNPEHALGVVFDSDAMPGHHLSDASPHTKITVILGGHWWTSLRPSALPTESEGTAMAQQLLRRHLGVTEPPIASTVSLQRDAIPQYAVGHCERMARLRVLLLERFAGRLRVAGASYRGIGVHDCVFSARSAVEALEGEGETGLECFAGEAGASVA